MLRQKSRQKWLSEGDANISFFHACIKARRARNQIVALLVDDSWVEEVAGVKCEIQNYFSKQFDELDWERSVLDDLSFPMLSQEQNDALSAAFSFEEVEDAALSCDGNKSPGPDGFNFNFIKRFWGCLKGDIFGLMVEFCVNGKLPKSF